MSGVPLPSGFVECAHISTNKCIWAPCCSPAYKLKHPLLWRTWFKASPMCWDQNTTELVIIHLENWNSREEGWHLKKCWRWCWCCCSFLEKEFVSAIYSVQYLKSILKMEQWYEYLFPGILSLLWVCGTHVYPAPRHPAERHLFYNPKVVAVAIYSWMPTPETFYSCYLQYKVSSYPHWSA